MELTAKQAQFWKEANHRWNIKQGATRSGKTYLDYYIIPKRIRAVAKLPGLVVLIGNTQATVVRNVIEPLQQIYGKSLVGNIRNDNKIYLFGEDCYILGADKISQVNKIRGMSIKYCYGDEVVTWNQEVFEMLKSRLDKPYSCFDGTCNPDNPKHWFKKFLDSDADIYNQKYTIYDNKFLSPDFVKSLENEYRGTVYFRRYILGEWCNAEGLLFPQFADNPSNWFIDKLPKFMMVNCGMDIGGTKSHSTIVSTGIEKDYSGICTFAEKKIVHSKGTIDAARLCSEAVAFVKGLNDMKVYPAYFFVDCAEQVILNSIRGAFQRAGIATQVIDCKKIQGKERILLYNQLLNLHKMKFTRAVPVVIESLSTALFDEKKDEDAILDDFTTDIDTFDAHFYSWSYFIDYLAYF